MHHIFNGIHTYVKFENDINSNEEDPTTTMYPNFSSQSLKVSKLPPQDVRLLFQIRAQIVDVKTSRKYWYEDLREGSRRFA